MKNETKYKIFECTNLNLCFRYMTLKTDNFLFY